MLPIAFLSFSSLIEDAMVRQLGDKDFHKREAATMYLHRVLRDTDGCRNYSTLLKVKQARQTGDVEIQRRAHQLYDANAPRYFQEHRFFCIYFSKSEVGEEPSTEAWEKVKRVARGYEALRWGRCREGVVSVFVRPKDFNSDQLKRLKAHKEVSRILPIDKPDQAWGPGVRRKPKQKE